MFEFTGNLILANLCVFAGALLHGSVGIGFALLAAPFLLLIDESYLPAPLLFASMLLVILMSVRERKHIEFKGLSWIWVGMLAGTLVGALVVRFFTMAALKPYFAGLILLVVLVSIVKSHFERTPRILVSAGVASGFLGATVAMSGPPVALVYQRDSGPKLRATLAGYFIVSGIVGLLILAAVGKFGQQELKSGLLLLPGVLGGFLVSTRLTEALDKGYTRIAILLVAAGGSIAVIAESIW